MVHILRTFVARAYHNLFVVVQVFLRHLLDLATHRGREHQGAVVLVDGLEDLADTVGEAHVQHLVGFVEDDIADVAQISYTTVLQVDESSWRGHDDVHTFLQGTHLWLYRGTAIDGFDMQTVDVLAEVADIVGNLQAQLTCRTQDQGLGLSA